MQAMQIHPNGGVTHIATIFSIFLLSFSTQQLDSPQHSGGHEPCATAHFSGFQMAQQSAGQLSCSSTLQTPSKQTGTLLTVCGLKRAFSSGGRKRALSNGPI